MDNPKKNATANATNFHNSFEIRELPVVEIVQNKCPSLSQKPFSSQRWWQSVCWCIYQTTKTQILKCMKSHFEHWNTIPSEWKLTISVPKVPRSIRPWMQPPFDITPCKQTAFQRHPMQNRWWQTKDLGLKRLQLCVSTFALWVRQRPLNRTTESWFE